MGIYINMEMPTKGYRLILINADGTVQTTTGETTVVPVPPHGDLIDKAEVLKRFCGHCFDEHNPDWGYRQCEGDCFDLGIIKHMPTILPAEEGE